MSREVPSSASCQECRATSNRSSCARDPTSDSSMSNSVLQSRCPARALPSPRPDCPPARIQPDGLVFTYTRNGSSVLARGITSRQGPVTGMGLSNNALLIGAFFGQNPAGSSVNAWRASTTTIYSSSKIGWSNSTEPLRVLKAQRGRRTVAAGGCCWTSVGETLAGHSGCVCCRSLRPSCWCRCESLLG